MADREGLFGGGGDGGKVSAMLESKANSAKQGAKTKSPARHSGNTNRLIGGGEVHKAEDALTTRANRIEDGDDKLTRTLQKGTDDMIALKKKREQRKIFEDNYMTGKAGADRAYSMTVKEFTRRLTGAGATPEEANELISRYIPPVERHTNFETGEIDFPAFYEGLGSGVKAMEADIRAREVKGALGGMTEDMVPFINPNNYETVADAWSAYASSKGGFNDQFATLGVDEAQKVKDFMFEDFRTKFEEAQKTARAKLTGGGSVKSMTDVNQTSGNLARTKEKLREIRQAAADLERGVYYDSGGKPVKIGILLRSANAKVNKLQAQIEKGDTMNPLDKTVDELKRELDEAEIKRDKLQMEGDEVKRNLEKAYRSLTGEELLFKTLAKGALKYNRSMRKNEADEAFNQLDNPTDSGDEPNATAEEELKAYFAKKQKEREARGSDNK